MPQMPLSPDLPTVLVEHLLKTKKEYEKLKKQEIHNIFIKMNLVKLASRVIWLMEILRTYVTEQPLRKYYVVKSLILLKIQKYDQAGLASDFSKVFDKKVFQWYVTLARSQTLAKLDKSPLKSKIMLHQ